MKIKISKVLTTGATRGLDVRFMSVRRDTCVIVARKRHEDWAFDDSLGAGNDAV